MAGKALVNFADFAALTGQHELTGPDEILNDAVRRTFGHPIFNAGLTGRSAVEVIRGGDRIIEHAMLDKGTGFSTYQPNQTFSPAIEDVSTELTFHWRFAKDSWGWVDQEVMMNEGDRKVQYKRIKKMKEQACYTSLYEGMEDLFWAAPNSAQMETSTGTEPYSIRAFVTENGDQPNTTAIASGGDASADSWTTIAGVNPDTKTKWQNVTKSYVSTSVDTQLVDAFGDTWRALKFVAPRSQSEYFQDERFKKFRIMTNGDGCKIYERITREANDSFNPSNDSGWATGNSVFRGLPVEYIEAIDNIGYTTGKPRYFWLNFDYIFPVFHQQRYMQQQDPKNLAAVGQPESWVVYVLCWFNIVCRSRRRQGLVKSSD